MQRNFSRIFSAELEGINARLIEVETDIHVGLHSFAIVGLADKALSESKERINAGLKNTHIRPPSQENRRITVNLAPADLKKTGTQYDLPIAIGYLLATDQVRPKNKDARRLYAGELALDGSIRSISGALSMALCAQSAGIEELILPEKNAVEAAMISGLKITPVKNLLQLIDHLEERQIIPAQPPTLPEIPTHAAFLTLADIKGQAGAKRALMIAAAGNHNLLMIGPPGTGKTMLAQALVSILPPLNTQEIIEITKIYSAANVLKNQPYINQRPFRSPHQSTSVAAVLGGGSSPRPGEISLAHRGVLFLDELPEFRRDLLEALRQPIEQGLATVNRIKSNLEFPARFLLIAAMNPCPCGYYGDPEKPCQCAAHQILRYQKKLSGPLLDRIDIQINVLRLRLEELQVQSTAQIGEYESIREKILLSRERQAARLKGVQSRRPIFTNSEMSSKQADALIELDKDAKEFLRSVFNSALISARGYYRILKTAQTIADLENAPIVSKSHVSEAFGYRIREQN